MTAAGMSLRGVGAVDDATTGGGADDAKRCRDDATREGGGVTTRDESGRWTAEDERVESDEGATRCRWTAMEVRGEEAAYCN
jgi:hypothetical protein